MRIPTNTFSPLMLFWWGVYLLALFSVLIAGVLVGRQDPAPSPARANQKE